MRKCKSCGDPIDRAPFMEAASNKTLPKPTKTVNIRTHCFECFVELAGGQTPMVTDPNLAPPGHGLTPRQKEAKNKTDS